jgi:ADP-heptose:LPS heptosyltransferase
MTASKPIVIPDCQHFTGYKPCFPGVNCTEDGCADPKPFGTRILIVNLEAMGNVLVTTSLLPAIKRKYPQSTISWITLKNAYRLLENNPYIHRAYVWDSDNCATLQAMKFDIVMSIDKSVQVGAFVHSLNAATKLGYGINENGVIIPLNPEAEYNYRLGLDDHLKFRMNQKPTTQLLTEAVGLPYCRDEYVLALSDSEHAFTDEYQRRIGIQPEEFVVGLNTGCSLLYPNKKMTIEQHVDLIEKLSNRIGGRILLLGGPEDTERNAAIVQRVGSKVVNTPTIEGVRRGLCYINACDVVVSGDSFGMHAAIALKKHVIVWFGVSCPQEIDLYDRGSKLIPHGLECAPCWKRECPYNLECIQMIDLDRIVAEIDRFQRERSTVQR